MSERRQRVESGIAAWAVERDGIWATLQWIVDRCGPDPTGTLILTATPAGVDYTFTPEGWTPCPGDCTPSDCPPYGGCDTHVSCDDNCLALLHPETLHELHAALDHWQHHGHLSGCSHGC